MSGTPIKWKSLVDQLSQSHLSLDWSLCCHNGRCVLYTPYVCLFEKFVCAYYCLFSQVYSRWVSRVKFFWHHRCMTLYDAVNIMLQWVEHLLNSCAVIPQTPCRVNRLPGGPLQPIIAILFCMSTHFLNLRDPKCVNISVYGVSLIFYTYVFELISASYTL